MKKVTKLVLIITFVFGLLTGGVSAKKKDTYKDRFTAEGRKKAGKTGVYQKDVHVWVYTSSFAKRFGMPEEWIDDSLVGAEAAAYRVDTDALQPLCGFFREETNCRKVSRCVIDLYISTKANIPWYNDSEYFSWYGMKSVVFTLPQNDKDKRDYIKKYHTKNSNIGIDSVSIGRKHGGGIGAFHVREYYKNIYKGLHFINGAMSCSFANDPGPIMKFAKSIYRKDGKIDTRKMRKSSGSLIKHKIVFPESFMKRVKNYQKVVYEPNSLYNELKKRKKKK